MSITFENITVPAGITVQSPVNFSASIVIQAGGGSGGCSQYPDTLSGGGGGGGACLYYKAADYPNNMIVGVTYVITVGAGGAASVGAGANGGDSAVTMFTVAQGGGAGGGYINGSTWHPNGLDGGCGGGSSSRTRDYITGAHEVDFPVPGTGTQGGNGGINNYYFVAGGGGGAGGSAPAYNYTSPPPYTPSVHGGPGKLLDILDVGATTYKYYLGPGGGGGQGAGGGLASPGLAGYYDYPWGNPINPNPQYPSAGNGCNPYTNVPGPHLTDGWPGIPNSGMGGGGGFSFIGFGYNGPYVGGNGGSGVVLIRSARTAVSTTGSPTQTTKGSDVLYTFNQSGTITF